MKPFMIYHLCQESFSFHRQQLIDIIVKTAKPNMIFLLGASLYERRSESIFSECTPASQYVSDCVLLILMEDLLSKELHEWQDKIENHCQPLLPVTTIVLKTATFEEWLKAGHKFAWAVWQSSTPVYDSGSLSLEAFQNITNTTIEKDCEKQFTDGLTKAKEFLAGSELFRIRKQHAMAAFMLHQAAEQSLGALLRTGTGFHANTHSIDRLLRYASLVSSQLPDIFPQKTGQEKHLFNLLQKAYIDTRYKEDYKINNEDLLGLTEKVRRIQEVVAEVGESIFNTPVLSAKP